MTCRTACEPSLSTSAPVGAQAAILHAAGNLLVEVGYGALTMKGIAERAGVINRLSIALGPPSVPEVAQEPVGVLQCCRAGNRVAGGGRVRRGRGAGRVPVQ